MVRTVAAGAGGGGGRRRRPGRQESRHHRRQRRARGSGIGPADRARGARRQRDRLSGPRGERTIAAEQFFTGIMTTALAEDEILTAVACR